MTLWRSCSSAGDELREPVFSSDDNFYDITRNFAFIGIMALGMTPVIITGGIDLSVGSMMGVVAIVCGLVLLKQPIDYMPDWWNAAEWTHTWWMALGAWAWRPARWSAGSTARSSPIVGLPPFVVTLGMLSAARSLAVVLSENRMLYNFGPDRAVSFKIIGGGDNLGLPLPFRALQPFSRFS